MAKTLIKNKLGNKTHTFALPCDDTVASAFCASFLDGEYAGFAQVSKTGSDVATPYRIYGVMIRNSAGLKSYLDLVTKVNTTEDELYAVLTGLTLNGVHVDDISVLKNRLVA